MSERVEGAGAAGVSAETAQVEDYAKGLDFGAAVAHAEARWQTELAMRTDDMRERAKHRYAAERASKIEAAIRGVAACARPADLRPWCGGTHLGACSVPDSTGVCELSNRPESPTQPTAAPSAAGGADGGAGRG